MAVNEWTLTLPYIIRGLTPLATLPLMRNVNAVYSAHYATCIWTNTNVSQMILYI